MVFLLTNSAPSPDAQRILQNLPSDSITPAQIDIILRCLNSDATQRFQSCDEIMTLLFRKNTPKEANIEVGKSNHRITSITHRDISLLNWAKIKGDDIFDSHHFKLFGHLGDLDFLKRLYSLDTMPSNDPRFKNFEEDIIQHTIRNYDWIMGWVFTDERLELFSGDDDKLLHFLCEIFHPEVRDWKNREEREVSYIALNQLNDLLKEDGYEIYESGKMSGKPVFSYRYCL